jgi:hypothetical protein
MWLDTWAAIAIALVSAVALFLWLRMPMRVLFTPVGLFFVGSIVIVSVIAGGWTPPFSYTRAFIATLVVVFLWYARVFRGTFMQRQLLLVRDERRRDRVFARVEERLQNLIGTPAEMSAEIRGGAFVFLAGGAPQRAAELLRGADVSLLTREELALHFSHLAIAELQSGDALRALAALDSIASPPQDVELAAGLSDTRALALAVVGRSAEALAIVDSSASDAAAPMTRAHAFAADGDLGAARATLERVLVGDKGREALAAVVRHRGPASPVAQSMLDGPGTPYR